MPTLTQVTHPRHDLCNKKTVGDWGKKQEAAFKAAKQPVQEHVRLDPVDANKTFDLDLIATDVTSGLWNQDLQQQ